MITVRSIQKNETPEAARAAFFQCLADYARLSGRESLPEESGGRLSASRGEGGNP